jgi:UDP-N-acetylglucosamine--N-acetylmuramyl-(pentapeptide) pyrophosphoryl-undecaprenol N-acetylglucosamine transferase
VPIADSAGGATVVFAGGGTGGHLYPALAIARTLVRLQPTVRPFFVGARRGVERDVLPQYGFPYELLDLHPLYRPRVWNNWRTIRGAIGGWRALGAIVRRERPALVVGTGGYASGLTLGYAVAHGVPLVEQVADSAPGLTARFFAGYARECYLGYPEAAARLGHHRGTAIVDTGNPIEPPPTPKPDRSAARAAWRFEQNDGCVLLVVGGSQGARGINAVVDAWVARGLPNGVSLIWATGRSHYDAYSQREQGTVRVRPYLSPIADAYAATDVALARAGAMTTAELCAWGLPMILVPLPTAAADHQTANAQALEAAGAAVHVPQRDLTPDVLDRLAGTVLNDAPTRSRLASMALARARPAAAEDIAARILSLLSLTRFHS